MSQIQTVRRVYHGGEELLTYDQWASSVIQDYTVALEVAERMLDIPLDPYPWNEDEAEFYEEFEIIDIDAFRADYVKAQEEDQ